MRRQSLSSPADIVMADAAYTILPARKYPVDKHLYAQRHLIGCCFSRLKQFSRVATRFKKPPKPPSSRHYRSNRPMDQTTVHTS